MPRESGQVFSNDRIRNTQFALEDSNFFSNVTISPGQRDPETLTVPVTIRADARATHQSVVDEALRRLGGEAFVEAQHDHLLDAATLELGQLVAQRGHAPRRLLGRARQSREIVARVGLEAEHATGHAAVPGFVVEQRQHRLVAAMHTIEIADGQRAGGCDARMAETSENLHAAIMAAWSWARLLGGGSPAPCRRWFCIPTWTLECGLC